MYNKCSNSRSTFTTLLYIDQWELNPIPKGKARLHIQHQNWSVLYKPSASRLCLTPKSEGASSRQKNGTALQLPGARYWPSGSFEVKLWDCRRQLARFSCASAVFKIHWRTLRSVWLMNCYLPISAFSYIMTQMKAKRCLYDCRTPNRPCRKSEKRSYEVPLPFSLFQ